MLNRLIKRFERAGKIRKQKAGIVQIEALLKEAILDLEEAKRIVNIAERATYLLGLFCFIDLLTHDTDTDTMN